MIKPIPERKIESYLTFLARWMALLIGMPMVFGFILKPILMLIIILAIDFIWHMLDEEGIFKDQ